MGVLTNERKKLLEKTQQSEKQLENAAHEWKTTFDSMPYGVMMVDNKFNILRINKYYSDQYRESGTGRGLYPSAN
jgi:PAS domain-containing protein